MSGNVTLSHLRFTILTEEWRITFTTLFSVTSIGATTENALILLTIYKFNTLRTISLKILAALSFMDLLCGVVYCPLVTARIVAKQNIMAHKVLIFIGPVLILSAVNLTAFLSYDRYIHCKVAQSSQMKKKTFYINLSTSILLPILTVPLRLVADWLALVLYACEYIVGYLFMITCYVLLLISLYRHVRGHRQSLTNNRRSIKEIRTTKTVLFIITTHLLTHLPFLIFTIQSRSLVDSRLYLLSNFLLLFNSMTNPLIYGYRTPVLSNRLKRMFSLFRKQSVTPMLTSRRVVAVEARIGASGSFRQFIPMQQMGRNGTVGTICDGPVLTKR